MGKGKEGECVDGDRWMVGGGIGQSCQDRPPTTQSPCLISLSCVHVHVLSQSVLVPLLLLPPRQAGRHGKVVGNRCGKMVCGAVSVVVREGSRQAGGGVQNTLLMGMVSSLPLFPLSSLLLQVSGTFPRLNEWKGSPRRSSRRYFVYHYYRDERRETPSRYYSWFCPIPSMLSIILVHIH